MDIWAWVADTQRQLHASGNGRLAFAMGEIPVQVHEGRFEQLEALAGEAIGQARELGLPWVELFVRHWVLRAHVGDRAEGAGVLPEAAALLEFAQREDARDCPHAPMVVQDYVMCLANIDGPGYAQERLAALDKVLERVDESWSCYESLIAEYAYALVDADRAVAALVRVEGAEVRLRDAGREPSHELAYARARVLFALERDQEAVEAAREAVAPAGTGKAATVTEALSGPELERAANILAGRALARLGRLDEAEAILPGLEDIASHPRDWPGTAAALEPLVTGGAVDNSWQIGRVMRDWISYLDSAGSYRLALDMALTAGRLAVGRGAAWVALRLAEVAESKQLAGAEEEIAALRASAEALPAPVPPAGDVVAAFDAANDGGADPEEWVGLLLAGRDAAADPAAADERLVATMHFLGFPGAAADLLWERVEREPSDEEQANTLVDLLLTDDDDERIQRLSGLLAEPAPAASHLALARLHHARERWEECAAEAKAVTEIEPGGETAQRARRIWADAAQELEDIGLAADLYQQVVSHGGTEEDTWRLIVLASSVERWNTVRLAAQGLGIELSGTEGPIEEEWHLVRVVLPAPDGTMREVLGLRTGPATARLLIPQPAGTPYNVGDVVIVDPQPLEPLPEDEKELQRFVVPFRGVRLLRPGGYTSWFFEGAEPDDDTWAAFAEALQERDWHLGVYSEDDDTVTDPATGEEIPGIYGWLAVPAGVKPAEADRVLTELTAGWKHPLVWTDLAKAGDGDVERHERIAEEYDL
ncbi:tetratricopeptide repeat protein [Bailinhaonella thermotolerans]|uniref:tetratricopeptide repeat protein n=1 Tax=Bailinhaonella thermotolerans TaxID=1070861 RepID=UPI0011C383DF|nr:tetratricopeptide repeat protein [Bailinhaonella thermotolerans]